MSLPPQLPPNFNHACPPWFWHNRRSACRGRRFGLTGAAQVFRHPKTAAISIDEAFVKIDPTGFLCLCMLFSFGAAFANPQPQTPQVQSAAQLVTPTDADAPPQNP